VDEQFIVAPDDTSLVADGADSTRIVMRVADEFGNLQRYSTAAVTLTLEGPAEIVGDNPFSLSGGGGAIWIRSKQEPGAAVLKVTHPVLGTKQIQIQIGPAEPDRV
jgi:beta-galactosidase